MGQFGVYRVQLTSAEGNNRTDCAFSTEKEPVDIYIRKAYPFIYFLHLIQVTLVLCMTFSAVGLFRLLSHLGAPVDGLFPAGQERIL